MAFVCKPRLDNAFALYLIMFSCHQSVFASFMIFIICICALQADFHQYW